MRPLHTSWIILGVLATGIFYTAELARAQDVLGGLPDVPASQKDVDFNVVSFNNPFYVVIPNTSVMIDNGTSARNVIVTFSADARVTDTNGGDLLLYAVSVDGGACFIAGPQNLAWSTSWDAHTIVYVPSLASGVHTIRPCLRILPDSDGAQIAEVGFRSLTVEGRTK
jgi:hypothetical protein